MPANQLEQEGGASPPLAFPLLGKKIPTSYIFRNPLRRCKKCAFQQDTELVLALAGEVSDGIITGRSSFQHCVRTQVTLKKLI